MKLRAEQKELEEREFRSRMAWELYKIKKRGRELEERYNHNHDSKGRFASKSGGQGLTDSGESDIVKNIELPAETDEIRSMSDETKSLISQAFDNILRDYNIKIDIIETIPLGEEHKNVPFQFSPVRGEDGELIKRIVINSEYDFMGSQEKLQERIMRNFKSKTLASDSIEGLISHEAAHVMTFQDCYTFSGYLLSNKQITKEHIYGISLYADASLDGAECIAEAFAAKRCGHKISEDAQKLLDKHIERWKK